MLGRAKLSRRSSAYQPARPYPTWTSHGHTCSGGASMVIARVQRYWARGSRPSPGIGAVTSAGVAPGQASTSQERSNEEAGHVIEDIPDLTGQIGQGRARE
ncbi:hypothetical protein [Nonomuraea sp. 10N515B]|uniref:hypothetical protein n=1 Tax=Nonomuraea sp. 10N515B TaxID=3457422 RepID=UPI003FCEB359